MEGWRSAPLPYGDVAGALDVFSAWLEHGDSAESGSFESDLILQCQAAPRGEAVQEEAGVAPEAVELADTAEQEAESIYDILDVES